MHLVTRLGLQKKEGNTSVTGRLRLSNNHKGNRGRRGKIQGKR